MINFTNVKEIEKIIRLAIINQTGLEESRVLNSLSIYGTELDKLLEENIYTSINQSDVTVLFELMSRDSNSNVSMTDSEEDGNITYYKTFKLKIIMYGNDSSDLALKLVGRFRTEEIRTNLYSRGIYLEKVSDPFILNEYKNETMWLRNDIDIDIGVKYLISPITQEGDFTSLTELIIRE